MRKSINGNAAARTGLLFLFACCMFLVSCLSWILEKPSFVLRDITLSPRSLAEMNLVIGLDVMNPNRFDLKLTSFEYTLHLNGEDIGSGSLKKEILVPASSTTRVNVPVAARFKNLGAILRAIIAGDEMPYKIEGTVGVKTSFGGLTFPFSKEDRFHANR